MSPPKAGTHLIKELMRGLGYGVYGEVRAAPGERTALDEDTSWNLASQVYTQEELLQMRVADDPERFARLVDVAQTAVMWAWLHRLGVPLASRYPHETMLSELVQKTLWRTATGTFSDTPANACWFVHEMDMARVYGKFVNEWRTGGEPRILFLHRDPRDSLLSMVRFLTDTRPQGIGKLVRFGLYGDILGSLPGLDDQIFYAVEDEWFPGLAELRNSRWLAAHPAVCKVSFEELVGPDGGGTVELQEAAVERVVTFVGADADPPTLAKSLFNRSAFTFRDGRSGAWRAAFSEGNARAFERRHGHLLDLLGYERR
ncbi:hypothetical protein ACFV0L_24270 [Streptosporangium canum]|uniref:hypothetical protein n=1 Tax=Streptosporangium canum TaxID=324952 RepID=UPI00369414D3